MKPFRDAIKAADPDAIVAIFFIDAGDTVPNPAWDQSIAAIPISIGMPSSTIITGPKQRPFQPVDGR